MKIHYLKPLFYRTYWTFEIQWEDAIILILYKKNSEQLCLRILMGDQDDQDPKLTFSHRHTEIYNYI